MEKNLKVELVSETAKVPVYANYGDAGLDFYSDEDVIIYYKEVRPISLGVRLEIPKGYYLDLRPRSGLSKIFPNYLANSPGTIDSGYRGVVKALVINNTEEPLRIYKGYKLCQGILVKYNTFKIELGEVDKNTDRGEGGFGSTGI